MVKKKGFVPPLEAAADDATPEPTPSHRGPDRNDTQEPVEMETTAGRDHQPPVATAKSTPTSDPPTPTLLAHSTAQDSPSDLQSVESSGFFSPAPRAPGSATGSSVVTTPSTAMRRRAMREQGSSFAEKDDCLEQAEREMSTVTIPWNYRVEHVPKIDSCAFTTKPFFWHRVQWACQFAFVSCLPCAALNLTDSTRNAFVASSMFLSFCVVSTQATVGAAVSNFLDICKGFLLVMLLLLPLSAAGVANHWWLWGAMYAIMILLVAFFTFGGVTKNTLLLFTIGMVVHYKNLEPAWGWKYGAGLVRDCLVGVAFGVLGSVFPLPRTNYGRARHALCNGIVASTICIEGLSESFFCDSDVQRGSNLLRIRHKRQLLQECIEAMQKQSVHAWYEPYGTHLRELEARGDLLTSIAQSIDTLVEVVEYVRHNPALNVQGYCTQTERFKESFGDGFLEMAGVLRDALVHMQDFRKTPTIDDQLRVKLDAFNADFLASLNFSQRMETDSSGEPVSPKVSGCFPRMQIAFFAFNMTHIGRSIIRFEEPEVWTFSMRCRLMARSPINLLKGSAASVRNLFNGNTEQKERFTDAVKMSVAMTSTIAVLLLLDSPEPVFSGPAVIAFVSGNDAGQTMRTSAEQVFGTVLGSVFGFLLASISSEGYSLGISIVVVALVTGFMRGSTKYGWIAFYAQFAAFGAIRPNLDASIAMTGIQQNVGAIVWYFLLNFLILPTRPSVRLMRQMHLGFASIKAGIGGMKHLIETSARGRGGKSVEELQNAKTVLAVADELPGLCAAQSVSLDGASVEPSLSERPYPTHLVARVIQQQMSLHAVLCALSHARSVLRKSPSSRSNIVLSAISPWVNLLIAKGMQLMDRLMATLNGDLADEDRLLVATCVELDHLADEFAKAEQAATEELLEKLQSGEIRPDSDPSVPPAILTAVHCLSSLHHGLYSLFNAVSEMHHALKEL